MACTAVAEIKMPTLQKQSMYTSRSTRSSKLDESSSTSAASTQRNRAFSTPRLQREHPPRSTRCSSKLLQAAAVANYCEHSSSTASNLIPPLSSYPDVARVSYLRPQANAYVRVSYASVCATRRTAYSYTRNATRAAYLATVRSLFCTSSCRRQHSSGYVRIREDTSAYVRIREDT